MFITIKEILYMGIITVALAYIFMDLIKPKNTEFFIYNNKGFDWEAFKFAILIAAPGVIIHELGHKFAGLYFGYPASFEIYWFGLILGLFLKIIKSPFILLAPAYVTLGIISNPAHLAIIAFAGPFVNLVLFLVSYIALNKFKLTRKQAEFFYLTKQINMVLFIFNMIPFPPLDGSKVLAGLIGLF